MVSLCQKMSEHLPSLEANTWVCTVLYMLAEDRRLLCEGQYTLLRSRKKHEFYVGISSLSPTSPWG